MPDSPIAPQPRPPDDEPSPPPLASARSGRFVGLDVCRGLIIVGMALDHCVYLLWSGAREPSFLFWHGPFTSDETTPEFLIRLFSSLCAPGFFLLMGTGLALFADARRRAGWTSAAIGRWIAVRGGVLVALQFAVENPLWTLKPGEYWLNYVGVLYALGASLLLASLAWNARAAVLASVSTICLILPEVASRWFAGRGEDLPLVVALLALPGKSCGLIVYFSCLPWLGICLAGILVGRRLATESARGFRLAAICGAIAVAMAVLLRWLGGVGNLGRIDDYGWSGAMSFVKYGPSLVFIGWNAGLILLSWPLLSRLATSLPTACQPLRDLGGSSLFFYVAHLALYASVSRWCGVERLSLGAALAVWLAGLLALWPACRKFARFKRTRPPESIWRMF
ncbi:MAG TPA: heparan-alpha-glucosaminide N-acetyltransferase domain-containing protein [Pirellulaceae bacterium]|nr:heparan-alpha-glucosaminide N-acetyltransferase domain-containing protein [Pirellulaceae bacterium]